MLVSYRSLAYVATASRFYNSQKPLLGRLGRGPSANSEMRLLTLLIAAGACSAQGNPLLKKALTLVSEQSLVGVTAKLGAFSGLLTGLNAVTEEVATRQEKRQDQKQSLRDKAAATANFVVWFHLDNDGAALRLS